MQHECADRARSRLDAERTATRRQIAQLRADLDGIVASSAGVATDDEHDPEGTTIAFERASTTALLAQAEDRLAEIDHALERLETASYGVCERCGKPIGGARLEARPVARTCLRCATDQR